MLITPTPIGDMRFRVTVVSVAPGAPNELGETQPIDQPLRTIWAKVTPISGTERYLNAQNTADVTHEIRCRYVPYIDHASKLTMPAVGGGLRTFDLVSVLDIEGQHVELLILAHEVVN
jgi:SPP1 family predicted phage head-tail adaptor